MAVSRPEAETVATDGFDERHIASADTSCDVPLERCAIARNCDVWPRSTVSGPSTATVVTVTAPPPAPPPPGCGDGAVGLPLPPLHAAVSAASTTNPRALLVKPFITSLLDASRR
jgi:hypothetical protein